MKTDKPKHLETNAYIPRTIRFNASDLEKLEAIRLKLTARLNVNLSANDAYVYLVRSAEV
jgi:hypothetical protein